MGILNVTPDSFSDGGRFLAPAAAVARAQVLMESGARMLDLGAESTRPGAAPIDPRAEWDRIEPVMSALRLALSMVPLSLDTRHAAVAARGLATGIAVINDVTGFAESKMLDLVADSSCGLIAMRSRSTGQVLHMPPYEDPAPKSADQAITELLQVRDRLRAAGIPDGRVLLDPGFGFGTTYPEDLALWEALPRLAAALAWPVDRICLGLSRKRFLAAKAGTPGLPPDQRDGLTAAAHAEALELGYRVFRTHAIG